MAEGFGAFKKNSQLSDIPKKTKNPDYDALRDAARKRRGEQTTPLRRPKRELKSLESLDESFLLPELGNNKPAFEYLKGQYRTVLAPLVEGLKASPAAQKTLQRVVKDRQKFRLRAKLLETQRQLTDVERGYLNSVQLLSVFNPQLVFAAKADLGITNEFARHHLKHLSEKTLGELRDGDYVPLVQIGLGPHGIISLSELVRNNPALARTALVVDANPEPGGPFGVPGGPAWQLNSANMQGEVGRILPDLDFDVDDKSAESERVRSYGSPVRYFPGERKDGESVRTGSINALSDYLLLPDDISSTRYATNEELQTVSLLQSVMLANRLALGTRVLSVEPNPNKDARGNKIITLEIAGATPRRLTITTDAVFVATGLGEPTFGFQLPGTRAEEVLNESKAASGFPKLSTALEAFRALADRTEEAKAPGETIVIYGNGDSTRTLVENLASLFKTDNPNLRNVKKVYVIATSDPDLRPRYAQTTDVRSSAGRSNLVEFLTNKIGDVGFEDNAVPIGERKLLLYDRSGSPIRNSNGNVISADACISATGFRPSLGKVFAAYEEGTSIDSREDAFFNAVTDPLLLPGNTGVAVAETLRQDPDVLFVGTASLPSFDVDKLYQLPGASAAALEKVGVENAVAIGFRGPDTQAAVNIWLNSRTLTFNARPPEAPQSVRLEGDEPLGTSKRVRLNIGEAKIPNNIRNENELLTPLLSYELEKVRVIQQNGQAFGGSLEFSVSLTESSLDVSYAGTAALVAAEQPAISEALLDAVVAVWQDADVQRYTVSLLNKKRLKRELKAVVAFKNGSVDARQTFVEA